MSLAYCFLPFFFGVWWSSTISSYLIEKINWKLWGGETLWLWALQWSNLGGPCLGETHIVNILVLFLKGWSGFLEKTLLITWLECKNLAVPVLGTTGRWWLGRSPYPVLYRLSLNLAVFSVALHSVLDVPQPQTLFYSPESKPSVFC